MDESREGGFRVVDKRGSARETEKEAPPPRETRSQPTADQSPEGKRALEEVTFVSFILSLYSSALTAFGKVPDPSTGKPQEHVEAGKQMIDILGILMEKTKGNLNSEETQLLDNVLYELRMLYLEKSRRIKL